MHNKQAIRNRISKWLILLSIIIVFLIGVIVMKQAETETTKNEWIVPTELPQEAVAASGEKQRILGTTLTLEAEDGELIGLTSSEDDSASGGKFVEGFDTSGDNLRFLMDIEAKGTYMILIRYKTAGGDKPNFIALDGERLAEYTFKDTAAWKDALIGQYDLNAGKHTFDIANSWGWIAIDYIQLIGGSDGNVTRVALALEGESIGPSDAAVTVSARADHSAEYRFFAREKKGDWMPLNKFSRHHQYTFLPPASGDYELKVQARGLSARAEMEAEAVISYKALPAYIGKPLVNPMFGDHMVLQRDKQAAIWGFAEPNTKITVQMNDRAIYGLADADGYWKIELGVFSAGGPHQITVSSSTERIELVDVLFGDVWLSSGQSNMEFKLPAVMNAAEEMKQANHPNIRFMKIPQATSPVPLSMVDKGTKWQTVTSDSAVDLSAVAYFFARKVNKETNVPIGILFSAVGGTKAESWTSYPTLHSNPDFTAAADEIRTGAAMIETAKSPIALFNGMIAPLTPYKLKGVLWYQGESNWGERRYNKLLPDLLKDWRLAFSDEELPFIIIQISAFGTVQSEANPAQTNEGLPEIREAQLKTVQNDTHACLVVTTDVGDSADIHPTNKQDVGWRSALCALGKFDNHTIEYSGPIYTSMAKEGAAIRLSFEHADSGLMAGVKAGLEPVQEKKSGELIGFAIAGEDKRYYAANAKIDGNSVIVSSDKVAKPVSVRYGWSDSPTINLYNKAGLPASPFRTDF